MRNWARAVSMVLATGACNDETAAAAPTAAPVLEASPASGEASDEAKGLGFFTKREPPHSPRTGGLSGITRELIDEVQRSVSEPLELVPDTAHFVIQGRPAVLLAHPEVRALWAKTESSDSEIKGAMDVVRACMEGLETLDDVVLGLDDEGHGVLVAHGKGIGTDATWRCFQTEASARGHAFDITITGTTPGKGPQLRESSGDVGYFPGDDTLVLVSKEWDTAVQERLRGAGKAAIKGELARVAARVKQDDALWVAGRISGKSEGELSGSPIAGIDDVTLDLHIEGTDLVFATSVDAGEPADATRVRDEFQQQLDMVKGTLPMLGMPSTVGDKLALVTEGDLVSLDFTLTEAEIRGLREFLERM